jgi:hypothetical protein
MSTCISTFTSRAPSPSRGPLACNMCGGISALKLFENVGLCYKPPAVTHESLESRLDALGEPPILYGSRATAEIAAIDYKFSVLHQTGGVLKRERLQTGDSRTAPSMSPGSNRGSSERQGRWQDAESNLSRGNSPPCMPARDRLWFPEKLALFTRLGFDQEVRTIPRSLRTGTDVFRNRKCLKSCSNRSCDSVWKLAWSRASVS